MCSPLKAAAKRAQVVAVPLGSRRHDLRRPVRGRLRSIAATDVLRRSPPCPRRAYPSFFSQPSDTSLSESQALSMCASSCVTRRSRHARRALSRFASSGLSFFASAALIWASVTSSSFGIRIDGRLQGSPARRSTPPPPPSGSRRVPTPKVAVGEAELVGVLRLRPGSSGGVHEKSGFGAVTRQRSSCAFPPSQE